jgi:hypothetical protein
LGVSGQPGAHPITVEYKSSVAVAQADLDKLQARLTLLNDSTVSSDMRLVADIKKRTNIKIIIEDAASYGAINYRVIDGRTIAIRSAWLPTATNPQVSTMLSNGFNAMLATPL